MVDDKAKRFRGYFISLIMIIGGIYLIWANIQKGGYWGIGIGVILVAVAAITAYLVTPPKVTVEEKVLKKIKEYPPDLQPQALKLFEPFRQTHAGMFLGILEKAKGDINKVEKISKVVQESDFDARAYWDEVG